VKRLPWLAAACLTCAWGFGQIVRDRTFLGQLAFYLPSAAVALALAILALLRLAYGHRREAGVWALIALLPLTWVLAVENRWTPPAAASPGMGRLRIVHWNVRHGWGWARIAPDAVAARADLYVFSEPPYAARERDVARARGFRGATLHLGETAVVGRGTLGKPEWLAHDALEAVLVPWSVDGATWRLLVVDLQSDIRIARDPLLRRLRVLAERSGADVILGDFNAPRRSSALTPPPPGYVHAYDAAGSGWSATWPIPIPLWAIDQCLVGPRLQVVGYRLGFRRGSDHRMQLVDLMPRYHERTP
jgi:hypothetical protein